MKKLKCQILIEFFARSRLIVFAASMFLLIPITAISQSGGAEVEIAAVGDILLDRGIRKKIEEFGAAYPFEKTNGLLSNADLAFGNLESPFTDECQKLQKKYSFRADPNYAEILRRAGLDVLSLANNHSLDCGQLGLKETIENLTRQKLLFAGAAGGGSPPVQTSVVSVKGINIGFAAFTAISPVKPGEQFDAVSKADPENVVRTIAGLRTRSDVVIASFHWGTEYASSANEDQIKLAKIAVDSGSDIVLGHHPHVLQGLQLVDRGAGKRKALIAYSLGNFVFDSPVRLNRLAGESMILNVRVDKKGLVGAGIVPVAVESYRPVIATGAVKEKIQARIVRLSKRLGTDFRGTQLVLAREKTAAYSFELDLDSDGKAERIEVDPAKSLSLRVFRGEELLWESVPAKWKPWKLTIADVDGDGKREMVVGVFKSTKFFPRPHNCLFVYGWNGNKGFPKWLGSSLGRPFTDFAFVDLDEYPGEELVALENTLDGKQSVAVYHWNSFGYTRFEDFGPWKSVKMKGIEEKKIELDADGERVFLDLENK